MADTPGLMTREEAERLMKEAVSGPWSHYRDKLRPNFGGVINEVHAPRSPTPIVKWVGFDDSNRVEKKHAANAALIAAAPSLARTVIALHDEIDRLKSELAIANRGGLDLLYDIRKAIGWNDKTSLSILPDGIRRARRVLATWDTPTGMDLEDIARAVKARVDELERFADDAKRLSGCLIAIHDAPDDATVSALKSVAYDAALNCITPDVAEYQIEKRSEDEIAARHEKAEREADAREA